MFTTVACENNIGFRIGMESSVDKSDADKSDYKNNESDSDSSFERELEIERMFCEGNALIEETVDINGEISEIIMDENGDFHFRDI